MRTRFDRDVPNLPQAEVVTNPRTGRPACGACHRGLQNREQWRCPWQSCRKWLRVA